MPIQIGADQARSARRYPVERIGAPALKARGRGRSGARPRSGRVEAWAWAVAVGLAGLVLTAMLGAVIDRSIAERNRQQFEESARQTGAAIEDQVQRYFDELRDIGAGVTSFEGADPEEIDEFVRGTGVFEQLESVTGIIVLDRVPDGELDDFVERVRSEGDPAFEINAIGEVPEGSPHYILTSYVPGEVDLELPIGTDVSTIESIRETLDAGGERGLGAAGSFQDDPLLAEVAEATDYAPVERLVAIDFFIGVPIQESSASGPRTVAWVCAPVDRFDAVLARALEEQPADLGISLRVDVRRPVLARDAIESVARREGSAGPREDAAFETGDVFTVDGVDWTLDAWSSSGAGSEGEQLLTLALLGGLLASVLLSTVVFMRITDRSRERAYVERLADREQLQRDILESVDEAVVLVDAAGRMVHTNPAWDDLRRVAGLPKPPSDDGERYAEVMRAMSPAGEVVAEAVDKVLSPPRRAVEVDFPVDDARGVRSWKAVRIAPLGGQEGGVVAVHTDITGRKRSEAELQLKASRDTLTGLLNRRAFDEVLDRSVRAADEKGSPLVVLFIDLDGFKPINDNYGHAVGDDVLRTVAQRVSAAVRASDRVGRIGGDEFVVLVDFLRDRVEAEGTAERILGSLRQPVRSGSLEIPIAASIGVAALSPGRGESAAELIDRADQAMYGAKQSGGSRWAWAPEPAATRNP